MNEFQRWLARVNTLVREALGRGVADLPEVDFQALFEQSPSPRELIAAVYAQVAV